MWFYFITKIKLRKRERERERERNHIQFPYGIFFICISNWCFKIWHFVRFSISEEFWKKGLSLFFILSAPPTFCFDRCFFFLNLFRMRERWCFCYALISNPSCVKSKNNNQSILKPPTKLMPFYGLKAYSFKTSLYQRLDHLMNNYSCVF